ncbi:DUF4180 domain-containing protein [Pseudonocardia sp. MCCB 268]|nr:DUF4180 domain-containing protein [Pseudonocardia cytotoxica]
MGESDATDLLGDRAFAHEAELVAIPVERLDPEFSGWRSGLAGAVTQKFAQWLAVRPAIVGGRLALDRRTRPAADWRASRTRATSSGSSPTPPTSAEPGQASFFACGLASSTGQCARWISESFGRAEQQPGEPAPPRVATTTSRAALLCSARARPGSDRTDDPARRRRPGSGRPAG